jgi:hypothetical protein
MKKILMGILLGILATSVFGQFDNTLKWQAGAIKIDGNIADWSSQPAYYDDNTKLAFDIKNDSNNLYMYLQISEQRTQYKIAKAGMSINFATKIKPKRKADLTFSPFISGKYGGHPKNAGIKKDTSIIKQKFKLSPAVIQSSGFAYSNGNLSTNKSNDIVCSVDWDSIYTMYIEIKIPLRELFGDNYDFNKISQKEVSLKIEENAMDNPGFSGGTYSHDDGSSVTGGDYQGGYNSGETGEHHYNGGGSMARMSMFEAQTLKQKFKLNTKNR